ncbi:MAG: GspH/FimT family pseudopilin [Halioglobus sp.]
MSRTVSVSTIKGFTLLELMLVLAILALLFGLILPSMHSAIARNRLRMEASQLMSALNLARGEAVSRNGIVSLCPSDYAVSGVADCNGVYGDGWVVFTNHNGDAQIDEDSDVVIQAHHRLPAGYVLTNKAGNVEAGELISFLPDGSSRKNRTLMFCNTRHTSIPSWSVVVNSVGRPRLARGWGKCTAI